MTTHTAQAVKPGKAASTSQATPSKGQVPAIFIDGEAGTTGLEIRRRLAAVAGIETLSIDPALRKDEAARLALMRAADVIVLCLPDEAARQAVALAGTLGTEAPRIVDASTAHRTAPGWSYGFAELDKAQAARIAAARLVSNPGCYATGAIALLKPLVTAGIVPADLPLTINAVSGYSGGGRSMIEDHEAGRAPLFETYGLTLEHKHIPEIVTHAGLTRRPLFVPSVGNFRQGMVVCVPLHLETLPAKPRAQDLEAAYSAHYRGAKLVKAIPADAIKTEGGRLDALALNDTDVLEIRVYANETHAQAVLVARLDNLGKGAAGAAVQNIGLMLGRLS